MNGWADLLENEDRRWRSRVGAILGVFASAFAEILAEDRLRLRRPTRAMSGNAHRWALLAKVRERTRVIGKLCCRYGEAARLDEAPGASWECPMHFNGT